MILTYFPMEAEESFEKPRKALLPSAVTLNLTPLILTVSGTFRDFRAVLFTVVPTSITVPLPFKFAFVSLYLKEPTV